jgi:hypothetical protein
MKILYTKVALRILLFFLTLQIAFAASEKLQEIKAPITSVKVFLNGAMITHTKSIKLKQGINEFAFLGLALNINKENISIRNIGTSELLSLTLIKINDTTDILSLPENILGMIGMSKDSLLALEKNITKLNFEIDALELEKSMFLENNDIIPNGKLITISELKITTEFYRERYRDVNVELSNKRKELKDFKKRKVRLLKSSFGVENYADNNLNFSIIVAEIKNGSTEYSTEIELSYLAKESGWIPVYEIFSTNNKNLKINYRAKILNNTGIDWNNQAITISTTDPFQYYAAPDLEPLYINRNSRNNNYDKQNVQKLKNSTEVEEEEIFTPDKEISFKIAKQYNFKSGLRPFLIDVISYDLNPEFFYRCAPKKEEQVYSIARIKDWEKLNLMDGEANIYNNGAFLGKSYIKPSDFEDYFELPLGVVDNIYVRHKLVSEFSSKKVLAGEIVATQSFEIKIKNISSEKVAVEILDQIPVSEERSVKAELIEITEGFEQDPLSGKITWKLELNGTSEKTLGLKYSLTYPKRSGYGFKRYQKQRSRVKF